MSIKCFNWPTELILRCKIVNCKCVASYLTKTESKMNQLFTQQARQTPSTLSTSTLSEAGLSDGPDQTLPSSCLREVSQHQWLTCNNMTLLVT